jgi:hypothetical protein
MTKAYAILALTENWTNEAGRTAFGVRELEYLAVKANGRQVTINIHCAPTAASRVMGATYALTGLHGIAMGENTMRYLGIKPGDKVEVSLPVESEEPAAPRQLTNGANGDGKKLTLKERMKALKVGDQIEITASQAKGSMYSTAKELNIKMAKVGMNGDMVVVARVSKS